MKQYLKILLVTNRTYRGQMDSGYYHLYMPLQALGHRVEWFDIVEDQRDFMTLVDYFKPDLVFCCMTGDPNIAPREPWEEIVKLTEKGNAVTFNWFCDDMWRFDTFSKRVCHNFHVCSTPEPGMEKAYRDIGYGNIILGLWHVNSAFIYPRDDRIHDISFIGALTRGRQEFFSGADLPIEFQSGLTMNDYFMHHGKTKIGISLMKNDNDPRGRTQMKQRPFEIAAGGGLLLCERHAGMDMCFRDDVEMITFATAYEFEMKARAILANEKLRHRIANAGYERFMREHDSHVRLTNVLREIMSK